MNTRYSSKCSACEGLLGQGDPFCPRCGKLSPGVLSPGDKALEIRDVPSERLREQVVITLNSWFPAMDRVRADLQLKSGPGILVESIDEASAQRLREAFAALKVPGRVTVVPVQLPWSQRVLNPGLGISAICLLIAALVQGVTGLVLVLLAAGLPPAWAIWMLRHRSPLILTETIPRNAEQWIAVADEYASVMRHLAPEDAEKLAGITAAVFELHDHLRKDSLVAVVSGEDQGDLYHRLADAVRTGVALGRRLPAARGDDGTSIRKELDSLAEVVVKTLEWWRELDTQEVKPAGQLSAELNRAAGNIERILQDVRPTPVSSLARPGKTPA